MKKRQHRKIVSKLVSYRGGPGRIVRAAFFCRGTVRGMRGFMSRVGAPTTIMYTASHVTFNICGMVSRGNVQVPRRMSIMKFNSCRTKRLLRPPLAAMGFS